MSIQSLDSITGSSRIPTARMGTLWVVYSLARLGSHSGDGKPSLKASGMAWKILYGYP